MSVRACVCTCMNGGERAPGPARVCAHVCACMHMVAFWVCVCEGLLVHHLGEELVDGVSPGVDDLVLVTEGCKNRLRNRYVSRSVSQSVSQSVKCQDFRALRPRPGTSARTFGHCIQKQNWRRQETGSSVFRSKTWDPKKPDLLYSEAKLETQSTRIFCILKQNLRPKETGSSVF